MILAHQLVTGYGDCMAEGGTYFFTLVTYNRQPIFGGWHLHRVP
ncbi:MAG TPA: hypothetical protein VK968_16370 [Roseimicrobium sp.]|nr:hypothetical protein [Roseimicrobium sp.]